MISTRRPSALSTPSDTPGATQNVRQRVGKATAQGLRWPASGVYLRIRPWRNDPSLRGKRPPSIAPPDVERPRSLSETVDGWDLARARMTGPRIRSDRYFNNVSNGTKVAGFGGATASFNTLNTRCCNGEDVTKSS